MLGKKGFGKINQVGNYFVICICPAGSKLKAVAGLFAPFSAAFAQLLNMAVTCGVGIIFGMRAVGYDKNLYILI